MIRHSQSSKLLFSGTFQHPLTQPDTARFGLMTRRTEDRHQDRDGLAIIPLRGLAYGVGTRVGADARWAHEMFFELVFGMRWDPPLAESGGSRPRDTGGVQGAFVCPSLLAPQQVMLPLVLMAQV